MKQGAIQQPFPSRWIKNHVCSAAMKQLPWPWRETLNKLLQVERRQVQSVHYFSLEWSITLQIPSSSDKRITPIHNSLLILSLQVGSCQQFLVFNIKYFSEGLSYRSQNGESAKGSTGVKEQCTCKCRPGKARDTMQNRGCGKSESKTQGRCT